MSFIRTSVSNGVGEIVLDRPKALNALDQTMIDDMYVTLGEWGDDDSIETVLVTSASDRAFCAGGDIRAIRDHSLDGDTKAITRYFSSEYRLDRMVADYPKPYISLIDGAAMGGGLGISVHGEIRVVTEKAMIAMPETAIGFFPDIGSTYFLPRLPEGVGMWLGLTGARIRGIDAVAVGLATHFVASADLAGVAESIRSGAPQADARATWDGGHLSAAVGAARYDDNDTAADNRRDLDHYAVELVQRINGGLYGAIRYSEISVQKGGFPLQGLGNPGTFFYSGLPLAEGLERFSLGLGYRFSDPLVFKIEYAWEDGRMINGQPRNQEDLFATEIGVRF